MEVKALSRMNLLGVVVVVLSGLLKGLHHNNRLEEATKVEGDWAPREDVEAAMVGVVEAVECYNSSSMVGPKNIKAGEGEGRLSKEVVEDTEVVVAVVVVEDHLLQVAQPDHNFPSCTKQPQFLIKLGSPLSLRMRRVRRHRPSHLSLQKWWHSLRTFPSSKRLHLHRLFNLWRQRPQVSQSGSLFALVRVAPA